MPDLDELEAKARALKEATERWATSLVDVSLPGATTEQRTRHEANVAAFEAAEEAYADACDPDTILNLIERVRAGEELYKALRDHGEYRWPHVASECGICRHARTRWESLAHSPQEAV